MEFFESVIFLHNLEIELHEEIQKFENEVKTRWFQLPNLEYRTIYHVCPYFEDIDYYFETNLMRIADKACRQYKSFIGKNKKLYWFSICNDYPDILNELCSPYIEAFESVSSKSMTRLKETREKLEAESSNRIRGYITNSMGYALAWETVNAVSNTLKTLENDSRAWQSATEPQKVIHNKLSYLWRDNFYKVFMKSICAENRAFVSSIIQDFCLEFGYTHEKYLTTKETTDFIDELKKHQTKQAEKQEQIHLKKKQEQEKYLNFLNNELASTNTELSNFKFAFFGENASKKKALQKKKLGLIAEISAVENPIPLQATYIAHVKHNTALYNIFWENYNEWKNETNEYWRFEFNEQHNDYVAYTPQNQLLFALGQGFVQKYGRKRLIRAKFKGSPLDDYQTQIADMEFSIFEIDE